MAQYHRIKWMHEREGFSQRQIAEKLGLSRNTVAKYLTKGEMPTTLTRKKSYGKRTYGPEVLRVLPIIQQWLREDQAAWKKQHHTATRIYQRRVDESVLISHPACRCRDPHTVHRFISLRILIATLAPFAAVIMACTLMPATVPFT